MAAMGALVLIMAPAFIRLSWPTRPLPAGPLREIASGGELSRVMLAIMSVAATSSSDSTLVFDEVDAGIGGHTARAVGARLRELGEARQVLCITHLAPVAANAAAHYVVTKQIKEGRAISGITLLDKKERVTELARMLGGRSDAARKHAEELLK